MSSAGARFGRYELLRPLGRGGMAEVFLARYVGPEGFEKRLVIKRVLPRLSDDRRLLRMFFEEARTQVSLSHGNLVAVFDFGRVGNEYFIAMEHVAGADVAALVAAERAAGRTLSPAIVAHVGVELCRALAFVHRRGFVHRDLTPRNVLVSVDGEVKLSDFGVALAVASEADPGLRGTIAYMAPEQARGERVDGRADLFSLGLVLAEALAGRRVRQASGDEEALAEARAGAPVAFDAIDAGALGDVLARATQPELAARFTSANEMSSALEAASAALGIGRERAVRELAARVSTLAPARADEAPVVSTPASTAGATGPATINLRGEPPDAAASSVAETYFRDKRSATFVDEVLGVATPPPPRSRRVWLAAGLTTVVVVVAGAGIAWRALRGPAPSPPPVAVAPVIAPSPAPPAPAAPPPAPPAPAAAPAPSRPAEVRRRRVTERRAVATQAGQIVIQCTPWCVPYVDKQPRGKDGRSFTLALPVGAHRVEAHRLEDHQARDVHVRAGDAQVLKFTFY